METAIREVAEGFSICVDCAHFHANGETPEGLSEAETAEWLDSLDYSGYWVVGEDEGFSSRPCHCCSSPLGGDRFSASILLR